MLKNTGQKKGENPPVGLILCAGKDNTVVEYTLKGMSGKIMAADYTTKLLLGAKQKASDP